MMVNIIKLGADSWLYLKRVQEELEEEVDIVKDSICLHIRQHRKHNFMDPQQRDQGQCRFGQSGEKHENQMFPGFYLLNCY